MASKYGAPAPPPLSKRRRKKKHSDHIKRQELSLNEQLIEAVRESRIDEVKTLLELGANINYRGSNGWCSVHWVARTGNLMLMEYLHKQGADTSKPDRPDAWQPLHVVSSLLFLCI